MLSSSRAPAEAGTVDSRCYVWQDEGMAWVVPLYSRERVNWAGRALVSPSFSQEEEEAKQDALFIVDNWRSSHSYPLHAFQMTLRNKARGVDGKAIIAQRLKRLPAILSKLRRIPHLNLSAMQDIGGCRAIVSSARRAYALRELYRVSDLRHALIREGLHPGPEGLGIPGHSSRIRIRGRGKPSV